MPAGRAPGPAGRVRGDHRSAAARASTRWRHAVAVAVARWAGDGEAVLRLVLGRGRGGDADRVRHGLGRARPGRAARRDGVAAVTLDRGGPCPAAPRTVVVGRREVAVLRAEHGGAAARRACSAPATWCSSSADGFVLEGPRSTVVIVDDDGALVTPPTSLPILPGTTAQALFGRPRRARRGVSGVDADRIADLLAAQGVWLLSSVTLAARVHTLDGTPLPDGTDGSPTLAHSSTPRSSGRLSRVAEIGCRPPVREYGRSYTGREVVRKLIDLWTCEVAAR